MSNHVDAIRAAQELILANADSLRAAHSVRNGVISDPEVKEMVEQETSIAVALDEVVGRLHQMPDMRSALEWYAGMSKRMGNASIAGDSQAILALAKEFAVDYGGRARAALRGGE